VSVALVCPAARCNTCPAGAALDGGGWSRPQMKAVAASFVGLFAVIVNDTLDPTSGLPENPGAIVGGLGIAESTSK